jgi:hypothetical protein
MKSIYLVCLIITTLTVWSDSALAVLGESIAEVETRYGHATQVLPSSTDERRVYLHGDIELDILFVGGKSLRETIHHPGKAQRLDLDECLAWMKELSGKGDWKLKSGSETAASWRSGDLLAAKIKRSEDGCDYLSVYGIGFMAYFRSKLDSEWHAPKK